MARRTGAEALLCGCTVIASPALQATFPASAFQRPAGATVARAAVADSAIENLGHSAFDSRDPCEHSQPAHALVAIAKAWHTCGVADVVLPGQRDVRFAQPLGTPAEGAVIARRAPSHAEALTAPG